MNGLKMAQDRADTPSCPGVYARVWEQIGTLLKERPRVLAAIDGRCGSRTGCGYRAAIWIWNGFAGKFWNRFILVEGSYSQHPLLADLYDYKLFLTCSRTAQEKRLRKREGERFDGFQKRWIPMEERYFTRCRIPESCDGIVDTTSAW